MKEIIYNYSNLEDKDINNVVKRAKALIINSNNEILFGYADKTYQFIGGHVEANETDLECLNREIKEESGINMNLSNLKPFLVIKYLSKDYPEVGLNTITINSYYIVKSDLKPNIDNRKLTLYENSVGFEYRYVNKDNAIDELTKGLKTANKINPVLDTIEAVKEFIRITSDLPNIEEWQ